VENKNKGYWLEINSYFVVFFVVKCLICNYNSFRSKKL